MEVLAVIVVLSILSIIVFPNVVDIINSSKENLYQSQLRELETVAKNFSLEHKELLDKNHLNDSYISLENLKKSKYLEQTKISNPKNGEEMNGCMKISYNNENNQYVYQYLDIDCENDSTISGYIIVYNNNTFSIKQSNVVISAYDKIIEDSNNISNFGLYDIGDYYVFRGDEPHNYVRLGTGGDVYRIVSLNKENKTIKLIKITPESSPYSANNSNIFITSSIAEYLLNFITNGTLSNYSSKVVDSGKWLNGTVDLSVKMTYEVLRSVEATSTVSNKLGLINVSDYVMASLNDTCSTDITNSGCKIDNYLYKLFGTSSVWTMDNSDGGKVITIESGNIIDHTLNSSTDSSYRIYPVVILKKGVTIKSGDGSSSATSQAYIIE